MTTAKTKPAAKPRTKPKAPAAPKAPAQPVHVDQYTRRSDDDALEGSLVEVLKGDNAGKQGAFVKVDQYDEKTGYPKTVIVRLVDTTFDRQLVTEPYTNLRTIQQHLAL